MAFFYPAGSLPSCVDLGDSTSPALSLSSTRWNLAEMDFLSESPSPDEHFPLMGRWDSAEAGLYHLLSY